MHEEWLTSITSAASRRLCIWNQTFDALRFEIERMCANVFFANSVARMAMRSFHCSDVCSGRLGVFLSINRPSQKRTLIRVFVTIF
jgi:hypothetical protein